MSLPGHKTFNKLIKTLLESDEIAGIKFSVPVGLGYPGKSTRRSLRQVRRDDALKFLNGLRSLYKHHIDLKRLDDALLYAFHEFSAWKEIVITTSNLQIISSMEPRHLEMDIEQEVHVVCQTTKKGNDFVLKVGLPELGTHDGIVSVKVEETNFYDCFSVYDFELTIIPK